MLYIFFEYGKGESNLELVYLWINRTESGFLNRQGVSFTTKYKIEFVLESNELEVLINPNYFNVFNSTGANSVINVSAIVGKNGTGKSTILNHIFETDVSPISKKREGDYGVFFNQINEIRKTIQIFEKDNELIVYHNLDNKIKFKDKDEISIKEQHVTSNSFIDLQKDDVFGITKIYLSNSYFNSFDSSSSYRDGNLPKAGLTINNLKNLSSNYFEPFNSFSVSINNEYEKFYTAIRFLSVKDKDDMRFQSFLDVVYFNYLYTNKKHESFDGKISTDLSFNIEDLYTKLDKLDNSKKFHINRFTLEGIEARYIQRKEIWNKVIKKIGDDIFDLITKLKLNVIFEIDYILEFLDEYNITKLSFEELIDDGLSIVRDRCNEDIIDYYEEAIQDIIDLNKKICNIKLKDNYLPEKDLAYKKDLFISHKTNPIIFESVLNTITCLFNKKSFIMKYIEISNLKFSSGERAYLNFFSWLNLLPQLNKLDSNITGELSKNIILMIDEIDLYCHPEWQQKFIKFFIDEINRQFSDIKIQVIFTTHSPIVLSDIPSSNVIYTDIKSDEVVILNRTLQTFAANIHKIFNDSFYLSNNGAMGSFAKNKINDLIKFIKYEKDFNLNDSRLKLIDLIGEPVIKNKIKNLIKNRTSIEFKSNMGINSEDKSNSDLKLKLLKAELLKLIEAIENESK